MPIDCIDWEEEMNKDNKIFISGVGLGWILMVSLVMTLQDWHGLEGYIEYCRNNWINLPWQVGGTASFLAAGMIFLIYYGQRDKTSNKPTISIDVEVEINFDEEANVFVARSPVFGILSQGESIDKAKLALKDAIESFLIVVYKQKFEIFFKEEDSHD